MINGDRYMVSDNYAENYKRIRDIWKLRNID
nr:MAG TPA: hypothetical protein [Caudoviricetes sp.]